MIKSFGCKETKKLFGRDSSSNFAPPIQKVALRKLDMIHAATILADLRVPRGNHLEKLQGKRKTERSIRINDQWRIAFVWRQGNVYKVKIEDYH